MYVINLRDLRRKNINLVGGKGANLGELLKKNFLVPEGFVVSTIAYERYLLSNGIYVTEEEKDDYEEIGECIRNGRFPDEIFKEIKDAYYNMNKENVAVRSSATAEDMSDASFAGQQESYLNVKGFQNVLQRIKDCFASCFTNRSVKYRKYAGYGFSEVKAAVIVQEMVDADVAGVLFTTNILSGNRRQMIINASYGLGQSVVAGTVSPDEYVLGRSGKVVDKCIGKKERKIICVDEGVVEVEVHDSEQKKWVLNDVQLKKLYNIGRKIERISMRPEDIEWALKDGEVYILQSRAITAFKCEEFSILCTKKREKKLSNKERQRLAFTLEHVPHAFYPLDFQVALLVGGEKGHVLQEAGIDIGEKFTIDRNGIVSLSPATIRFNKNIFKFKQSFRCFFNIKNNRVKGKQKLKDCKCKIEYIKKIDLKDKSLKECGVLFKEVANILQNIGYARFRYFIIPATMIGRKLRKYLKSDKELTSFDILKELPNSTRKINSELNKLAEELKKNDINKDEKINEFLNKYGDKSDYSCYPFSALSWKENRKGFLELLNVSSNKLDNKTTQSEIKYADVLDIIKKNAGKNQEAVKNKVDYFRECHMYREKSQYMWEECHAELRKILERVSEILNIEKKDLWYLMFCEMLAICERGKISSGDMANINVRKMHREKAEQKWNELHMLVAGAQKEKNVVTGINGSDGIKRGRACVVLGKEDFSKLKNGDVLICNYISPEWTPLFSMASAVVSDTGGALSHAAIVAREYGIPAVFGTGNGTSKIHDGDEVWVNASKGTVLLC